MKAISYSNARQNLKEICDTVVNDYEPMIITRERGENVVILSEDEYSNLLENLFIRSNPENYKSILKSMEQLNLGNGMEKELIEVSDDE